MDNSIGTIAPEPKLRCAIYTRFDMRSAQRYSLGEQERICREAIASKEMIVEEQFVLSDCAAPGPVRERKGLESLLKAASQNPRPFDYIVVDDLHRLSRDTGIVMQLYEKLKKYGIELHVVAQKLDSIEERFVLSLELHSMIWRVPRPASRATVPWKGAEKERISGPVHDVDIRWLVGN